MPNEPVKQTITKQQQYNNNNNACLGQSHPEGMEGRRHLPARRSLLFWPIQNASALLTLLCFALQPQVTGEPITGIQRSCVSGQLCVISGLTGTGLGNGDRIVLSQECGAAAVTAGMPGSFGESMGATSSGTYFRWSTYLQADGAEYRICWCSIALQCTSPERFTLDIGTMTLTGPQGDLPETCYSGRACVIDNIEGVYLRDGDTIMVLDACNERGIAVEGFPNNAITTTGAVAGTEHGWGEAKVTAVGGVYMLCWCAKGATCIEVGDHRKQVGSLTLVGPGGGFNKACSVFEACTWSGMIGQGVADGDRIMILEACGTGLAVAGFPNSDIAEASGGGGTYTFGSTDNVVIAGGAEYAMCWCQAAAGYVCAGPSNFITRAGTLIVSGPRSDHEYACKKGSPCEVHNFQGIGLVDGDKIKILIECGTGSSPSGFPANGEAVASNGGASYLTWAATATNAQFGSYRICWCKAAWGCSSSADFKMDAGAFRVVGVNAGLSRSCHAQAPCQISGITGSNLRNGDLITIMTSCGSGGQEVPGWPRNGTSFPATGSGTSFNWGFSEAVQAPVGTYKMCWCPANDYSGCDEPADFTAEAGTIELRGPERQSTNATCVAWQEPSCLLGPFRFGVGLTYGTDKIMFVRSTETCGVNQPDPDVGAGLAGKLVEGDMMVYMDAAELPYGGVWKMCYCANFDSGLDQEATACSSKEDFSAEAGLLSVQGAYPGQAVNCTRNQVCSFTLAGYGLSKDLHQIAIADSASFCGQRSPTTAESVRRRRDFTGNPYLPADLTGSGDLAFNVDPVQALGAFAICFCVPAPSSGACEANSLRMFHQSVGHFDIRGAAAGQSFECGRGGPCTLLVQGRGLSALDRVKIVNSSTACDGDAQQDGFFRSFVPAEPAPGTNSTQARFALGRVTLGGSFKVCYCANLDGCSSLAKYTHQAGVLDVTDPLSNLTLVTSTSASVTVSVESRVASSASIVRCAISEFEPRFMPTSADLKNGLTAVGLGKGESTGPTKLGTNFVEMFFSTFVKPTQAYRVWCVEASAQSFILPSSPGGTLFVTPQGIVTPTLRVFPGFLWPQAKFFAELYQVYNAAVTPGRRLAAATQVRIQTGASEFMCNGMDYDIAVPMRVVDAGQAGQSNAVLSTETELEASQFRLFLCFFAGPNATGIALSGDRLTVQSEAPTITIKRMDGLVLQKLYRGLLLQAIVSNAAVEAGLLHWTTASGFATNGCDGASRAPPAAQAVQNGETWFFTMQAPTGQYVLCYLGKLTEGSTTAPFNGLGEFDLVDIVESVSPANSPMSTRSTVRLTLKVRMPGSVTCIARNQPTDVRPTDFAPGVVHEGRAVLTVEPPTDGVDPEFSREFQLSIALISYQRSGLPLRVWCLHSLAEEVVFPETRDGILVPLQVDEAFVTAQPAFIWNGAKFRQPCGSRFRLGTV
ncbi:unnamed protein product [Polarella glacialis]|uniref:Uncharacterized protein n=1 Tax=Polarella glacialis TaxID=89957 RepID=A0A813DVG7_POLGL|nr:unnamed protein product [Polarella glacialis]